MEVAWETHQAWDAGNNRPGRDSTEVTRERPGRVRVRVRDELSTVGRHRLTIHMVRNEIARPTGRHQWW